ncbi:anaerobic sulfatase maturase [Ktedonobacter racemifer]|uniref:Radical SAM domain protein n=1 Tax=Ktedonobacter racemifer DSM 44963 TaxID=485913 RepID=D6TX79_KTERA|nr:anaerobic sulfatase maturase [Ktedonobacter racemifer]EFH84812.1 Radical SAM domain protein [Ktedonobacter racemifer DSM 44963]
MVDVSAEATPLTPPAFHIMTKPRGAICNLDCAYCYFLSKELLYPGSRFRMSNDLLEEYIRQYIEAQSVPEVTFAWQGGEPTLMGLDFFRLAVSYQQKYSRPGMRIYNALQTNATRLDDDWCQFFREQHFLIGVSLDGPREFHDIYRVDKGGNATFDRVMTGIALLKKHQVEFNILTTLHAANAEHPLEVYRFLRDEVGTQFIQFIPIVERDNETGFQEGDYITPRSVTGEQYGQFLSVVFDEWVRHDVGQVFVQIFDEALAAWSGNHPGLCIFGETCGTALAMEHNGDIYSCDHYVEPKYKLGNMQFIPLAQLVGSEQQRRFGQAKRDTLPRYCRECEVRFICNGGCPKDRTLTTPDGEPGLNYLCAGYKAFFKHIDRPMKMMAQELRAHRPPANIMYYLAQEESALQRRYERASRNEPCPCGSGRKFKRCHGA